MIRTTVRTKGMMSSLCEKLMKEAICRSIPQAKNITSSHRKNTTAFLTGFAVEPEEILKIIEDAGYRFISVSYEPCRQKGLFGLFGLF